MKGNPPTPATRKPRRRWRWHVPPALLQGPESLEGSEILDETSGALGLLLWQSMRDVTLWAGVPDPEERAGLFAAGAEERRTGEIASAGVDAAIEPALRRIAAMAGNPAGAKEDEVMQACREVSLWADGKGMLATALQFAQAAAVAAPANAAAGFRVGQLARRRADYARAETWFRRTIGLGRQAKDWGSYAEAFLGLGNLYVQRGNFPAARKLHIRGLRAARRHGMRDIQGRALHDLFGIAVETGQTTEAQDLARAAFRAYGPAHRRLQALANDLAYFWVTRGLFAPALAVFQAIAPHMGTLNDRMVAQANLARAAGGAGDRTAFEQAWEEAWSLAHEPETQAGAASALLDLGHGAMSLQEWTRAERAAEAARQIATQREQAKILLTAESVLDAARARKGLAQTAAALADSEESADTLAADLVRSLNGQPAGS
jgi:tetratricopeptide (TPR) repeat protein